MDVFDLFTKNGTAEEWMPQYFKLQIRNLNGNIYTLLLLTKTIAAFVMPLHNHRFWHGLDKRKLGCMIHKMRNLKSLMQHVSTFKAKNST